MKLKRLRAGSYETHDGRFFTYRYVTGDGVVCWPVYEKAEDTDDRFIACPMKLTDAKRYIGEEVGRAQ